MSSHYETLGVSEESSAAEIKSSYRKLSMQWHPDRNPGNAEAESKFKEISAAYETIGNDAKRQEYDQQRRAPPPGQGMNWNMNFGGNGHIDDILSQFFSQHGFGGFRQQQPQKNRDITLSMTIGLEDAFTGKQSPIQFNTPSGRRVELIVNIPGGVDNGVRIRFQGQGDHGNTSLPPGDLYILINVADHPIFSRNESGLIVAAKIDAIDAIVGTKHRITGIDGQIMDVTIPPGTQHGATMRIPSRGMPKGPNLTERGDLLVTVNVVIPIGISSENMDILKDIQSKRSIDNT